MQKEVPVMSDNDSKIFKNTDNDGSFLKEGHTNREGLDVETLMFRDGRRRIDMVLAYEEETLGVMTEAEAKRSDQRKTFQKNLIKEGKN